MHVLKIDRSFVDGLGRSSDDVAIVTAIISLARTLGLTVTAEGIESDDQLRVLTDLGCEYGQGWLFAKALPAAAVTDLLHADAPFG
jgi:EAL domain-containing protein (putative c-di-GMP-specific phosphodiesterase class I)